MEDIDKLPPIAAYLEYCKQGKLAYQYCLDDDTVVFYPRVIAPVSGSTNLEWRISKGLGTVYATTSVYGRDTSQPPHNVCMVELDEGFRMMSRVEEIPSLDVKIGMRVQVRMHTDEKKQIYPVFTPVEEQR
jgi:uncharacterized OB-fold protein